MLDRERIALAKEVVEVAKANVAAAEARLEEAEAILDKYEAEVDRWDTEVNRLTRQVARDVIDPWILFESTNQLKSSIAALDKAKATIKRAKAELLARTGQARKDAGGVRVAEATLKVAESEERYAKAWVDYLTLNAPFAGVISARNANTFDFVQPTTGDPTAYYLSPDLSPSGTAAPIYVVERLDIVRIFLDIPERDANFVNIGTKASVLARAFRDTELPATVTRTSWALNMKSRTLRAEVDLSNPEGQLLPGMYAYVKVIIERPDVQALPLTALVHSGDQTFCWLYESGKAVRTEVETGVSDDKWIEVSNRRPPVPPEAPSDSVPWTPIDGKEQVILGDLSALTEGGAVEITAATVATKLAIKAPRRIMIQAHDCRRAIPDFLTLRPWQGAYLDGGSVMHRFVFSALSDRLAHCRRLVFRLPFVLLAVLAPSGCHHEAESHYTSVGRPRQCGWSSRRSGTSSGSSGSPASRRATSARRFIRK